MNVEIKGLGNVIKEFGNKGNIIKIERKKFLNKTSLDIINIAKRQTPVKTGNMKRSYKYKVGNDKTVIYNDSKYFGFINNGTKTHFIKPKGKGILAFKNKGKIVFSKGHKVKGIKAFKIIDKTIREVKGTRLMTNLNKFTDNIIKKR